MPLPSSPAIERRMKAQRRRDTSPEMRIRKAVHAKGLRYRVDRAPIDGMRRRADLVFGPAKVAVYVDGCFWHVCPQHGSWPKANADWWRQKLEANVARDRDTDARLQAAGWQVVRIWEHEDPERAADLLRAVVRKRTPMSAGR